MRKKKVVVEVVEPTPAIKIIDKTNRGVLSEGREYQLGFGFLKKVNDTTFETVQPISPCKDYLNDVVFTEQTGKDCYAYGLNYKKQNIFSDVLAYMAMKICPHHYGGTYDGQEADTKNLNENFKNTERFVNSFEEKLKLPVKTSIEKVDDNLFFLNVPVFWCQYTYLISLYSLLIRCGQWYKDGDEMEYFTNYSKLGDAYNVKNTLPKLNKLIEGEIPKQNLQTMHGTTSVHNLGIVSFKF